jgi:Tol biopolymer transport system component
VFLVEVATGATTRLSVSTGGTEANGPSTRPTVSSDGRWVTFVSGASNLVPGDNNGADDLFLHDTLTGQTTRVSTTSAGAQANGQTVAGTISPDGGYVALASDASNLVFGDTNGVRDIFVKVLGSGLVVRASVSSSGTQAGSSSFFPGVSWYGTEVSFHTLASLVPGDTNGQRDVYKHSLDSGLTTLISATPSGTTASGTSWLADLDTGGRVTVFQSDAPDLVVGDTNGVSDAFVQLQKATWYIDVAGAGSGTGTPGNPYTSIQYAIDRPETLGGDELLRRA